MEQTTMVFQWAGRVGGRGDPDPVGRDERVV